MDLLRRFAAKAGLPEGLVVETARETAARFVEAWEHHDAVGRLPPGIRARVSGHLKGVPPAQV